MRRRLARPAVAPSLHLPAFEEKFLDPVPESFCESCDSLELAYFARRSVDGLRERARQGKAVPASNKTPECKSSSRGLSKNVALSSRPLFQGRREEVCGLCL